MNKLIFFLLLISLNKVFAQEAENTFYIGHSLINLNIPAMTHSLSVDAGISNDDYKYQIGNGANLWYQWDTLIGNEQGTPYQQALPTGTYDNLIFTEAIALQGHIDWSDTYGYANKFCEYAHSFNPDIAMYVYETWHCLKSGTNEGCEWDPGSNIGWRQRLDDDLSLWENIANYVLSGNPGFNVKLIPGGQGMARLYDAIEAGTIIGRNDISQFYSDDIHPNNDGNYFIACIMFACIYERSPVGLTNQLHDEWGSPYPAISPDIALRLQELAWETVCEYGNSGVECTPSSTNSIPNIDMYYDQTSQLLKLSKNYTGDIFLYNTSGMLVEKFSLNNDNNIDLNHLFSGAYFVKVNGGNTLKILRR